MGSPQISSANRKSANFQTSLFFRFAELPQLCHLADLRCADWDTKDIWRFAICGLIITNLRICDLRTGTPQKFAIAEWAQEFDNRTNQKNLRGHLCTILYTSLYRVFIVRFGLQCQVRRPHILRRLSIFMDIHGTVLVNYFSVTKFTNFTSTDQGQLCSVTAT